MKNVLLLLSLCFLAFSLSSCDVEFGTPFFKAACNEATFSEYCFDGAPVWCVDGYEDLQEECYGGTFCTEIINGHWDGMDLAGCFDPHGPDTCSLVNLTETICEGDLGMTYTCMPSTSGMNYWILTDEGICF